MKTYQLMLRCVLVVLSLSFSCAEVFESINAATASPIQGKATTCEQKKTNVKSYQANWVTKLHNNLRRKIWAANMQEMTWSWTLSRRAQALANTCVFQHGMMQDCSGTRMGQNLQASWGNTYPEINLSKAVYSWYNEKPNYVFKTGECNGVCGHYTQVVWSKTTKVGCGYAKCPTLKMPSGKTVKNAVFVACNYQVAGNYAGLAPFTLGKKCSKCPAGTKCQNNLCARK